jgi:hypothetical protein
MLARLFAVLVLLVAHNAQAVCPGPDPACTCFESTGIYYTGNLTLTPYLATPVTSPFSTCNPVADSIQTVGALGAALGEYELGLGVRGYTGALVAPMGGNWRSLITGSAYYRFRVDALPGYAGPPDVPIFVPYHITGNVDLSITLPGGAQGNFSLAWWIHELEAYPVATFLGNVIVFGNGPVELVGAKNHTVELGRDYVLRFGFTLDSTAGTDGGGNGSGTVNLNLRDTMTFEVTSPVDTAVVYAHESLLGLPPLEVDNFVSGLPPEVPLSGWLMTPFLLMAVLALSGGHVSYSRRRQSGVGEPPRVQ